MTKNVNLESVVKSVYTKNEIRYAKAHVWTLTPIRNFKMGEPIDIDVNVDGKFYPAGTAFAHWHFQTTDWPVSKKAECVKAVEKRAKAVRKQMENNFNKPYVSVRSLDEWIKAEDDRIRKETQAKREEEAIDKMLKTDGLYGVSSVMRLLRMGENIGNVTARYAKENGIECNEFYDNYNGYARSCSFTMIRRSFYLNIRRGYHLFRIAGVLTFIKGTTVKRDGMACEWIEQGRAIADIHTVKGWLVRGEHIKAKTLKEAQAINAEHRAKQLAALIAARKKDEKNRIKEASLMITFEDSLASGNCRPGTQSFKDMYEREIGREASYITAADLRKYAKKFGVSYYAERVIRHMMNH